ncbi:MAG TPA: ribosome silencing factor [Rubrivivax sp.]|nr:ribosome silencing factor [Burkholderiales bacterium]HNU10273.1 ribosome silencing factor [Rubrivivax sp.]
MDIRKLQRAIVDGLEDVKANDIVVFNTEHLTPLFERVIIASGNSNRQTKALASSVRDSVKKRGLAVLRTEGEDNGEWIIVDCGAAVAHIMQPHIRDYYRLEEIWGGKSVHMKLAGKGAAGLPKASEDSAARPSSPRVSTVRVTAARSPSTKPTARKTAAAAPAARKPASKASASGSAGSKGSAPKTAASRAPASKTAASKATASKPAARKRVAR